MKRTIEQQLAIIAAIMQHLCIYTRQNQSRLEPCEMTDWHMSAAIYAMSGLGCTYLIIGGSLKLSRAQVLRHSGIAAEQIDRCIFFETAAKLYRNAGIEALQNLQTKQPA